MRLRPCRGHRSSHQPWCRWRRCHRQRGHHDADQFHPGRQYGADRRRHRQRGTRDNRPGKHDCRDQYGHHGSGHFGHRQRQQQPHRQRQRYVRHHQQRRQEPRRHKRQAAQPPARRLGNYGGPAPTIALQAGSPAIGSGAAIGTVTEDERGSLRPANPDIGAFQTEAAANLAVTAPPRQSPGWPSR